MADIDFIKTVALGGYDKAETEKMFDAMEQRISELQAALHEEQSKCSQLQEENEVLDKKSRELTYELQDKEQNISELKITVEDLRKIVSDTDEETGSSAAAKSMAFLEAQRSSDSILEKARTEAEAIRKNAVRLAEEVISEANEKADNIIREAKTKAAAAAAESDLTKSGGQHENFSMILSKLDSLKDILIGLESESMRRIMQCKDIISEACENTKSYESLDTSETENKTESGSTADIEKQEEIQPLETIGVDSAAEPADKKDADERSNALDMLMNMAEALNDD